MRESSTPALISLSLREVALLTEALDAYEYWQLGDALPRNNGAVWIPGDLLGSQDPYWDDHGDLSATEIEAIVAVRECRELAERLRAASDT
jgi:hypothetical protein